MAIKTGAVLILAGLVLTACASQQERAAKRAAAEQTAQVKPRLQQRRPSVQTFELPVRSGGTPPSKSSAQRD